jgi:hypothetical protein
LIKFRSDTELALHASSITLDDYTIHKKAGQNFSFNIGGAQSMGPSISWNANEDKILTAKTGVRLELKE